MNDAGGTSATTNAGSPARGCGWDHGARPRRRRTGGLNTPQPTQTTIHPALAVQQIIWTTPQNDRSDLAHPCGTVVAGRREPTRQVRERRASRNGEGAVRGGIQSQDGWGDSWTVPSGWKIK
ncbi:hypothetical protein Skr01_57610 [Sphaerisporangium krabiense]|nr:hypothetical protein Skr01_57610 [Sphaerisporangium krabiense]